MFSTPRMFSTGERLLLATPVPRAIVAALFAVLTACGGEGTGPDLTSLSVTPTVGLVVGVGGTSLFVARSAAASGESMLAGDATWVSDDTSIATVSDRGSVTGVSAGVTSITASLGAFSASAQVEVYVPASVVDYLPGVSYFGRAGYVEYIPGELPVVLSAPHGGALTPTEIPDRTSGTLVTDRNTLELTLAVRDALIDLTGYAPHVIISHLRRTKLDPNREVEEAAQDDPFAENAWREFHAYIVQARVPLFGLGGGMYFDMHGHGHAKQRLELGYLLSADWLNQADANLNSLAIVQMTSIREMGRESPISFSQLLRGPTSLGGLLEAEGVAAIPSPADPSPGSDAYFTGGYNTRIHGSMEDGELVSGIQIEHHFPGLRDTDANRRIYAARLAVAIRSFMLEHFGYFEP